MTWAKQQKLRLAAVWVALLIFLSGGFGAMAYAQSERDSVSANDFGGIGLLQTRTARFGPDGGFQAGTSFIEPYRRWFFRLTLVPWFEGVFRYTDIRNRLFSNIIDFSGSQTFKDRGADIKFRLWPESRFMPQIAVGMQDGLGTGLFRGEYLVASKRFRDLDVSFGIGWGYLGNGGTWRNPLASLTESLKFRSDSSGTGGAPLFSSWFSGEFIAPFFGIEYMTPISGLTLKLEYEGNDYETEPLGNALEASSYWNYGFSYSPFSWLDVSLAFERGNSYMSRLSLLANLHDGGLPKFDPPPPPVRIRDKKLGAAATAANSADTKGNSAHRARATARDRNRQAIDELFNHLEQVGLEVVQFELTHDEARVHYAPGLDSTEINRAERLAGMVVNLVPTPVERVAFVSGRSSVSRSPLVVSRNDIERNAIVDFLFDRLESEGFQLRAFDLTHEEAMLTIEAEQLSEYPDRRTQVRAAQAVLRASPTPLERVTILTAYQGSIQHRATFHRDEVIRESAVNELFEAADADGFAIESLDISYERATVYVSAGTLKQSHEYLQTAHKIAKGAPIELNEVRLFDLVRDTEVATVTLRKDGKEWKTAASASEYTNESPPDSHGDIKIDDAEFAGELFAALAEQDLIAEGVQFEGDRAIIYLASRKFRQFARNVGRAARVAANVLPDHIEEFTIIYLSGGMEMSRITIWRKDLENIQLARGSLEGIWARADIQPPAAGAAQNMIPNPDRYPHFEWGIGPGVRQHVGGPSKFILYQVWARANARLDLMPGLFFTASYGHNLYNNFDRIRLASDSVLSRVRSDIKEYLQQGESALVLLQGDYVFSPASQWYARLSAGLFEEMYGGVSTEVLYRPFNSRLALGAEFNWVRQREFDVKFKFRNYNTGTGHFNIYYQWPWYDMLTSVHLGKYLARDRGGTFVMSREFDSGIRMGAWVTLTNIPFEEFGEGSFDKGIFVSIPFELFLLQSTTKHGRLGFRPLTRDGGQMVHVSTRLYDLTADANLDRVVDDWDRLLD